MKTIKILGLSSALMFLSATTFAGVSNYFMMIENYAKTDASIKTGIWAKFTHIRAYCDPAHPRPDALPKLEDNPIGATFDLLTNSAVGHSYQTPFFIPQTISPNGDHTIDCFIQGQYFQAPQKPGDDKINHYANLGELRFTFNPVTHGMKIEKNTLAQKSWRFFRLSELKLPTVNDTTVTIKYGN
ncbi:MAG: hypothetical protein P1U40_09840 [Coxiellaceae bacterium]|nr:hypothetical protein [Coxiellaceae bacterium]